MIRDSKDATEQLVDAVTANIQRVDLNPVEEAQAFFRLKAEGRGVKQIASELAISQKLVSERLGLLELSEPILNHLARGDLQLGHVPVLRALAAVSPTLAEIAASAAIDNNQSPQGFALNPFNFVKQSLPDRDVWITAGYVDDVADLSEKACKLVTELNALRTTKTKGVTLGHDELEQAITIGVAVKAGSEKLLDPRWVVASREWLVDTVERRLTALAKTYRQEAKRRVETDSAHAATIPAGEPAPMRTEEQVKAQKRAARELELKQRDASHAYNQKLGQKLVELPELTFDKDTALFMADLVFAQDERIGGSGLQYVLPQFCTETEKKDGSVKRELDCGKAREYAAEFVAAGQSAEQVLTRLAVVLGAELYADENVVPQSSRQGKRVSSKFPTQTKRLLKPLKWRTKAPTIEVKAEGEGE